MNSDVSRRDFLVRAAMATLGVTVGGGLSPLLGGEPPVGGPPGRRGATSCIMLHMMGGMSHLDTLDPKTDAAVAGPFKPIPTKVDGVFLGPHLPQLAKRLDRCALLRCLSSNQGAHEQGQYLLRTGYLMRGATVHPTLGAWDVRLRGRINPTLPPYVSIMRPGSHSGAGYFPADCQPLPVNNPVAGLPNSIRPKDVSGAAELRRRDLLAKLDQAYLAQQPSPVATAYHTLYDQAVALMSSTDLEAFDISKEPAAVRATYGDDNFANGCLLARRLVEHGVRHVEVALNGWDTHDDNFDRVEDQSAILDRSLSALLDDLEAHGLLKTTLVVVVSEFGRSPAINGNNGRDHHPLAFPALLAGGGVIGGKVYGSTDPRGHEVAEGRMSLQDFQATLAYGLGLPLDKIEHSGPGRPFTVADKGKPLSAVFA